MYYSEALTWRLSLKCLANVPTFSQRPEKAASFVAFWHLKGPRRSGRSPGWQDRLVMRRSSTTNYFNFKTCRFFLNWLAPWKWHQFSHNQYVFNRSSLKTESFCTRTSLSNIQPRSCARYAHELPPLRSEICAVRAWTWRQQINICFNETGIVPDETSALVEGGCDAAGSSRASRGTLAQSTFCGRVAENRKETTWFSVKTCFWPCVETTGAPRQQFSHCLLQLTPRPRRKTACVASDLTTTSPSMPWRLAWLFKIQINSSLTGTDGTKTPVFQAVSREEQSGTEAGREESAGYQAEANIQLQMTVNKDL